MVTITLWPKRWGHVTNILGVTSILGNSNSAFTSQKSDASFQQQQKNHVETVQNLLWHVPRGFVYKHCLTNCILPLCLHRSDLMASFDNSFSLIPPTSFYIFLLQKYYFQAIISPKLFDKFANYFLVNGHLAENLQWSTSGSGAMLLGCGAMFEVPDKIKAIGTGLWSKDSCNKNKKQPEIQGKVKHVLELQYQTVVQKL